jgi:NAD-dependent deacetylase
MFDEALITSLQKAKHIAILTGAGVSAESGIPTFRDAMTGLWEQYDPQQLASERGFRSDPALVWGWYEWRRCAVISSSPNPAHFAIAQLQQVIPKLTLISQNVDDLHERAGSRDVLHLHGSLHAPHCIDCLQPYDLSRDASCDIRESKRIEPPRCLHCGDLIRPGVVWFGESLPTSTWHDSVNAAENCNAFISIGTSGQVYPAATLPRISKKAGSVVIQLNAETTDLDAIADFNLLGKAGELLPLLLQTAFPI